MHLITKLGIQVYIYIGHHQCKSANLALGRTSPSSSCIIKRLDVFLPLILIESLHLSVIGHQAIDLSFHIGRLRPDTSAARVATDLILQLTQQSVAAIVPSVNRGVDFVCFVNGINRALNIPKTVTYS